MFGLSVPLSVMCFRIRALLNIQILLEEVDRIVFVSLLMLTSFWEDVAWLGWFFTPSPSLSFRVL